MSDEDARRIARETARAWGFTYEIYLLHYLSCGPVSFGQQKPLTRASIPPPDGANVELLDDPLKKLREDYRDRRNESKKKSQRLDWVAELEYAICSLKVLHEKKRAEIENNAKLSAAAGAKGSEAGVGLGDYLNLCAWQVVQSTHTLRDRLGDQGMEALKYLEHHYRGPYVGDDLTQLGDARISDERSELQIKSGQYPAYTYQVTVDRPFSEVSKIISATKRWHNEACGRLLSLGPAIGDPSNDFSETGYRATYSKDELTLNFDFPVRVQPEEDDWTGENATTIYRTDLSGNDSTVRLDFSLVPSKGRDTLLEEDSGYYLVRKSIAKVGRSDLIVQRSLWFANRAFGMNAALRPLFKMIVDHRVLREFAELCRNRPDDLPGDRTGEVGGPPGGPSSATSRSDVSAIGGARDPHSSGTGTDGFGSG